jgi:hypothetical protein
MKPDNSNPPLPLDEERVLRAVRAQQRWLRALTALAVLFWALAVIGSVALLTAYTMIYAPKEKQMMAHYQQHGRLVRSTNTPAGPEVTGALDPQQALGVHFTMNYAVTRGILAIVVTVIILSCGTLTTLLLVVLNRRVTLKQINHSLTLISEQLKALQKPATPRS